MFSSKLMVEMLGALEWQLMSTLPLQDGISQATFLHVSIQVSPCGMLGKIMTSWLAGEDGLGVQVVSGPSHLSWGKAILNLGNISPAVAGLGCGGFNLIGMMC